MSVLGWIVVCFLGLYALGLLALVIYLTPQLIREQKKLRAMKK